MARKTVTLEWLTAKANTFLAESDDTMADMRRGVAALLEAALFDANAYRGYGFLPSEFDDSRAVGLREDYDDTRRKYM